jgi:hypothetical protein
MVPIGKSRDLARIVALPRRPALMPEPLVFPPWTNPCRCKELGKPDCIRELRPVQRWGLEEAVRAQGLAAPISVGGGKSLLGVLMPTALDSKRAVMLVPAGQELQIKREHNWASQHLIAAPWRDPLAVREGAKPQDGLYVIAYSSLCIKDWALILLQVQPDLIIADEGQKLSDLTTATGGRVIEYFAQYPKTRFCVWSGTLTGTALAEYAHLFAMALHDRSPFPLDPWVVKIWGQAVDAKVRERADPGELKQLFNSPFDNARTALNRRMIETEGVVFSMKKDDLPPLEMVKLKLPKTFPNPELKEARKVLETEWKRPDGEELVLETEYYMALDQLQCGFFYRWEFGDIDPDIVAAWKDRRSIWNRALREFLKAYRRPGLDSPELVELALQGRNKHQATFTKRTTDNLADIAEAYSDWKCIERRCNPVKETRWIDDTWLENVYAWAQEHQGIVWFTHEAVGDKLATRMPIYRDGGRLIGEMPKLRRTALALSVQACGTGVDGLQRIHDRQLLSCPIVSGKEAEQLLGRLTRIGQKNKVICEYFDRDQEAMEQAKLKANYIKDMMRTPQLLLTATWR